MPGEIIDRPNPGPSASLLPDSLLELSVKLDYQKLSTEDADSIAKFRRASNYIAAAMIFLSKNALLERDLEFDDIKPRLLGHWGTCPVRYHQYYEHYERVTDLVGSHTHILAPELLDQEDKSENDLRGRPWPRCSSCSCQSLA